MRYLQHTYRVAALVLLCGGLGNVFGQLLSADQQKFLDISSKSFSITAQNDRDLRFLDKALENRRIVLLGEFTHGSKEINLAKNRLISYLHERLGFNVLLLESGLGEVYSINFCRGELTSRQMVTNLTGPWQTEEYVDLMHFLKARPKLRVAGFDVQRTGRSFAAAVKGLVKPEDIVDLERRFTELLAKLTNRKASFLAPEIAEKESLIADYRKLRPAIDPQIITSENEKLEFVQKVIDNRIEYLEYLGQFRVDNDYRKRFRARDTLMAQNILWLANEMYPKDKIVISGHNFHVARHNEKETVMGGLLSAHFGKKMFSIGIFGGEGEYANNNRQPETIKKPGSGKEIQAFGGSIKGEAAFLAIPRRQVRGSEFLYTDIEVSDSFINLDSEDRLNLSKAFDGLIFVKAISPPAFLN